MTNLNYVSEAQIDLKVQNHIVRYFDMLTRFLLREVLWSQGAINKNPAINHS